MPFAYRYDRGQHRTKHCWNHSYAGFRPSRRGMVGKCPNTLNDVAAQQILNGGVGWSPNEGAVHPTHIFNVHEGVVYEAAPTEPGKSYHGYPWLGELPPVVKEPLRAIADQKGCRREFEKWLKDYER